MALLLIRVIRLRGRVVCRIHPRFRSSWALAAFRAPFCILNRGVTIEQDTMPFLPLAGRYTTG